MHRTPSTRCLLATAGAALVVTAAGSAASPQSPPALHYVAGSTHKVQQLLGEEDKQRHQPTLGRTVTRYGLEGTDLGSSFDHDGRVYFLFGDTVGTAGRALDSIGVTAATSPGNGIRLDFLTADADAPGGRRGGRGGRGGRGRGRASANTPAGEQQYLTIQPPGLSMGAFEVPVAGLSLDHQMFVVVSTNHSEDRSSDRSVLTRFTLPSTFTPGRTISQLPAGHFVKMSLHLEPGPIDGMPEGGPFVLMWGTGAYRRSDAYLSIVPAAHFEDGRATQYFAGTTAAGAPTWSEKEAEAVPVARNGTMGDLSVTWCAPLGLWLMTYDSRPPATRGVLFSYSRTPWGPWAEPQVIFEGVRDGAFGTFIHSPRSHPPDGLVGPVIGAGQANPDAVRGGEYAPYVVERWTRVEDGELTIYYTLSTWNPYVVVLMTSRLRVG
jgi:Domain of unknown function (DUF4185)